jgi:hexokinase
MTEPSSIACLEFLSDLDKTFLVSLNHIKVLISQFHKEMKEGLSGHESSLKMIPSLMDRPKGNEKGEFFALDLGGTHFRVLTGKLDGKRKAIVSAVSKFTIPKKDMQGSGVGLFDFIAGGIDAFLTENRIDRTKVYDLAFTFSFPVEQTNVAAGKLIVWTKGFTAKGVQGQDVVELLNQALLRKHIRCINVRALTNDTVGTLAAGSYADAACDMGVIMGTGTNACYREKLSNIHKLKDPDPEGYMIVNMEWGNFDKVRLTHYDRLVDEASVNPGAMYLEKMVSGMYLGEITRLVLTDLIKKGLVFHSSPDGAEPFKKKDSFKTRDMSLIEGDETEKLHAIETFLENKGISNISFHDKTVLKRLCETVSTRAAGLGAGAISAVVSWMDPELKDRHTVAVDGSLFEKYPGFGLKIENTFKKLYGEEAKKITLVHSRDGSGKGAAIMAAVAASAENGNI